MTATDELLPCPFCGGKARYVYKWCICTNSYSVVCTECGGSGGGKPDSAMGGGKDVMKLDDALASVDDFVASKL